MKCDMFREIWEATILCYLQLTWISEQTYRCSHISAISDVMHQMYYPMLGVITSCYFSKNSFHSFCMTIERHYEWAVLYRSTVWISLPSRWETTVWWKQLRIDFELAAIPDLLTTNLQYFTTTNKNGKVSLNHKNNKFVRNGVPHYWIDKSTNESITSHYWRCCLYWSHCSGAIITRVYGDSTSSGHNFGTIHSITPHSKSHDDTWTPAIAERIVCLETMKHMLPNILNSLKTYKCFQRLFPNQSIEHFKKYKSLKSFLNRYIQNPSNIISIY